MTKISLFNKISVVLFIFTALFTFVQYSKKKLNVIEINVYNDKLYPIEVKREEVKYTDLDYSRTLYFSDSINSPLMNVDIPIKKQRNNEWSFITKDNTIQILKINDVINTMQIIHLPNKLKRIKDYEIITDSTILLATDDNTNRILQFNHKNHQLTTLYTSPASNWTIQPHLGLRLTKTTTNSILIPSITLDRNNKNNSPFTIYTNDFKTTQNRININYTNETHHAPYFEYPIVSALQNQKFWTTFSGTNCLTEIQFDSNNKPQITNELKLHDIPRNSKTKTISDKKLDDYKYISEMYALSSYVIRIIHCNNILYRITKLRSNRVDKDTRKFIPLMDSPWVLEKYNLKTKKYTMVKVPAKKLYYSQSIEYRNEIYFMSYSKTLKFQHIL